MTPVPVLPEGAYNGAACLMIIMIAMAVILVIWIMIAGLADLIDEGRTDGRKKNMAGGTRGMGFADVKPHRQRGKKGR